MPQGLQAWDAAGNMVVDIGDYSTRIFTSKRVAIPSGVSTAIQYPVPGVTAAGHFAVITEGNNTTQPDILMTNYTAVTYNGGFWLIPIFGTSYGMNVTVDIYAFT